MINWFTSFGYFDDEGNLTAAKAAFTALKPSGKFLIETIYRPFIERNFRPRQVQTVGDVRVTNTNRMTPGTGRVRSVWTMTRGDQRRRCEIDIQLYNAPELRAVLKRAGFDKVELYCKGGQAKLNRHARRMIAIATKPKA